MLNSIWNTEVVRKLLNDAFSMNDLVDICFDHYRVVYDNNETNKQRLIQDLIEHCDRHAQIENLLSIAKQKNPRKFDFYKNQLTISKDLEVSTDGQLVKKGQNSDVPASESNPNPLVELFSPGGAVSLKDRLYVKRAADAQLEFQLSKSGGTTTIIRAPRQTGKTSLLIRGKKFLANTESKIVYLSLEKFSRDELISIDIFLNAFSRRIFSQLNFDDALIEEAWRSNDHAVAKFDRLFEKHLLPQVTNRIFLLLDEADILLKTEYYLDFFTRIRVWHNNRAMDELWDRLSVVLVVSTEPYLLIDNPNQSPFNVGLEISLKDFDEQEVWELNEKHVVNNGQQSPLLRDQLLDFMTMLNGHPYLTRLTFYKMVTESLSWQRFSKLMVEENGPIDSHLRHQLGLIQRSPELVDAMKGVYAGKNKDKDNVALHRLHSGGILKRQERDTFTFRCGLYELYFYPWFGK